MQSLDELPKHHFGAILADPPWHYATYSQDIEYLKSRRNVQRYYNTMKSENILIMPVEYLAADNCVLFLWVTWPTILDAFSVIKAWGFTYKTCAFSWMKANGKQIDMFSEEEPADMLLGYWTRANSEVCLLATKGSPKRLNADVRQGIIAPRREHSRKPDGIHERIERLVAGPYLELFARQERKGWTTWGNETKKFKAVV